MSYSIEQLRGLSDALLIATHDQVAQNTNVGVDYFLNELARRDQARAGDRIEVLTRTVKHLTWIITALTFITAIATIIALFR